MLGGVEAVSRQCRLTPESVCRAVSGCSVGAVSGLLDSGDVRTVSRCQAVSECRSVGVSGCRTGVECRECRECRNALTLLDTVRTSPLSECRTLVSECRAECRSSVD